MPLSTSWETLPDLVLLLTESKGFCNGRQLPDFLLSSLENHFPAGLPSSCAPIRTLAGSNQEQHLIPMEMPDGATQRHWQDPESKTPQHEERPHTGTPAEGMTALHGNPSGWRCIMEWGGFQRIPGLRAPPCLLSPPTQLWVLLNTPFPPKPKSPHH